MKPPPSLLSLTAAVVAGALIGAGGGAGTYAALSSGSTKTVVRQVPVSDSQPAASTRNDKARRTGRIATMNGD